MLRPRVARLTLERFRNHAATALEFPADAALLLFHGDNGAGKTNLLEALSLLAPGRGLRGAALSAMARAGAGDRWGDGAAGGFAVGATLVTDPALPPVALGTGTSPDAPERRLLRVNGAPAALNSLAEWVAVAWLTPAMDRLFADSAGGRRRFLDRLALALHPRHAHHASRYEAATRARTRLLTDDRAADPEWLAALEGAMAEHGAALHAARADTVARLDAACAAGDAAFPRAALRLDGWDGGSESGTGDFADALRRARPADAAAGRATVGPHRADLHVTHADKAIPAALASTGEQKALLTGMVLAHAELVGHATGRAPLLLLDEAAAHLDAQRRAALWDRLAGIGAQCFVTATDAALFDGVAAARYAVTDGRVEAR